MKTVIKPVNKELVEGAEYSPAMSIIMPFQPKMTPKTKLTQSLKAAINKIELLLMDKYPGDVGLMVLQKLRGLMQSLNYNTHKNSIAIYVSPVFEKILYLDIEVEERITVDKSFDIRDLVYTRKELQKYLVLFLGNNESRLYLGDRISLVRIVSNTPASFRSHTANRQSNASPAPGLERQQIMLDKFLHQVDNSLRIILQAYPLPLFMAGNERLLTYFKSISSHMSAVVEMLPGNYGHHGTQTLVEALRPHITDWKKVLQKSITNRLEAAATQGKLSAGITAVWQEAMARRGSLLVIEKNYRFSAGESSGNQGIQTSEPIRYSYILDAVDSIIEKVLENGGDVEFVDAPVVSAYDCIALVQ